MLGLPASARRVATLLVIAFALVTVFALAIPGSAAAADLVTVTFDTNYGAAGSSVGTRQVERGAAIGQLPSAERSRYQFKGWYTQPRGGSKIADTTKITTSADTYTVYARWAPTRFLQGGGQSWSGNSYAGSTIAARGCGVATTAMAVYTLGGNVNPGTAATWSRNKGYDTASATEGRTKDAFFKEWPKAYGVTVTQLNTADIRTQASKASVQLAAREAVEAGNWVICMMAKGNWTTVGHFVLWYDTEGDYALIRDPSNEGTGYDGVSRSRAPISKLQSQAKRYFVVSVPNDKKVFRWEATKFKDVAKATPYSAAILKLADAGIINGYSDSTFKPVRPVIRQQFAKMILGTIGLGHESATYNFKDVPKSQSDATGYPYHFIAQCVKQGIIQGYNDNTFRPANNMTRAQLITMVVRTAEKAGKLTKPAGSVSWKNFDAAHFDNTRKAYANGLLGGLQGLGASYNFNASATRGEVAQVLANYMTLAQ